MWVICNEWSKNHWCSPLNFKPRDWILTTPVQTSTVFDQNCVGLRNELRFPKYKCSVYVGMLCMWRRAACFVLLEALAEVMEASLLPDMFDNESQDYSDLKFLQNRGHQSFTEHEYRVHINMAFNLEVIEVSDAVTNHLGYGSLSPHINLLSSQKDLRYFYYICYFFSLCTGFLCWFL